MWLIELLFVKGGWRMKNKTSSVLLLMRIKVIGRKDRILRRIFVVVIGELGMIQKTVY